MVDLIVRNRSKLETQKLQAFWTNCMIPTDIQWHLFTVYTLLFQDKHRIECSIKVLIPEYFSWEKVIHYEKNIAEGK